MQIIIVKNVLFFKKWLFPIHKNTPKSNDSILILSLSKLIIFNGRINMDSRNKLTAINNTAAVMNTAAVLIQQLEFVLFYQQ